MALQRRQPPVPSEDAPPSAGIAHPELVEAFFRCVHPLLPICSREDVDGAVTDVRSAAARPGSPHGPVPAHDAVAQLEARRGLLFGVQACGACVSGSTQLPQLLLRLRRCLTGCFTEANVHTIRALLLGVRAAHFAADEPTAATFTAVLTLLAERCHAEAQRVERLQCLPPTLRACCRLCECWVSSTASPPRARSSLLAAVDNGSLVPTSAATAAAAAADPEARQVRFLEIVADMIPRVAMFRGSILDAKATPAGDATDDHSDGLEEICTELETLQRWLVAFATAANPPAAKAEGAVQLEKRGAASSDRGSMPMARLWQLCIRGCCDAICGDLNAATASLETLVGALLPDGSDSALSFPTSLTLMRDAIACWIIASQRKRSVR